MSELILPPGVAELREEELADVQRAIREVQRGMGFVMYLKDASFPAHFVVHMPSGPVFCCERHAKGAVSWANAMGLKPGISYAVPKKHNCRGCVAVHQAKFKPGRAT